MKHHLLPPTPQIPAHEVNYYIEHNQTAAVKFLNVNFEFTAYSLQQICKSVSISRNELKAQIYFSLKLTLTFKKHQRKSDSKLSCANKSWCLLLFVL